MNSKQQYIEKLRAKALDHSYTVQGEMIDDIADELEAMDVVWVPREPTQKMIEAGQQLQDIGDESLYPEDMRAKWKAMLNAAENTND